jgi:protein-disulfide isomerase
MPVLGSYEQAYVIECFGADKSVDEYYDFMEAVYDTADSSLEGLLALAATRGGNADEIRACVGNRTFEDLVESQMQEARSFNINGTPASVIINNADGRWQIIEGAYPLDEFERVINQLLS